MKTTLDIINHAMQEHPNAALAFSGGSDSIVLMDVIFKRTDHRPVVIYADSGMEHPETLPFIRKVCKRYGASLHVAKPTRSYLEQWQAQGWPMLGKLAAVMWMQKHRDRDFGYRLNVTGCCRNMKILPARKLTKQLGCTLQFTGQRGNQDDALRGMRELKDGSICYIKADKLTVCNPLLGWTDMMIRRYIKQNKLQQHPAKARGAITIGCLYCGGGGQFTNSGFRILRHELPEQWRRFIVDNGAGEIILSIKYDKPLDPVREAVKSLGGISALADAHPWIFDFLRMRPLRGYDK
ncbi:phosphoadenosine phosphosulfate reductase family protein [bacterium]|nr:phosphoadenosine phosphosulfate reductase family protein [bacterium]